MTSRPGQLERPFNVRTLSRPLATPGATQRPSPHRAHSQQYQTSSPVQRTQYGGSVDLKDEPAEVVVGNRSIPRSRLNLEIGHKQTVGEVTQSPNVEAGTTPISKPPLVPRSRPKLPSDFNGQPRPEQHAPKPMPFPPRPGQYAPPKIAAKTPQGQSNTVKKDARPKPFTLEIPNAAPSFPPNGYADFNPWTGNHPEDQFSENVIRQGFYDKSQMTRNETGSAKVALFPSLKHKSGLQTLSSLFTTIMAQRRFHGHISSSSTFKPPPRVTVTDTKREIWLKDLANSTIPLRRLSRSIPHGIRGRVLLDQSLSKNIPIERAVWLAKCVGANELRSFRRKGVSGTLAMGGEAKWIRDFTVCVEQFVEGVIGMCGEAEFRSKINYAIRLATHFHTEHLLDREHYLDWVVTSLETTTISKLPIWLLIAQIYWKDLLQHRKYGRRVSSALLKHLVAVADPEDQDILGPLYDRLKRLLKDVLIRSPDSFISPKMWIEHGERLQVMYASEEQSLKHTLQRLSRRNTRLSKSESGTDLTSQRRLLIMLDATLSQPLTSDLAQLCWDLDPDKDSLARTVLEWAVAQSRPGPEKIFAAVRILRSWKRNGLDVTEVTLKFLQSRSGASPVSASAFYHIMSELVRSKHFSAARYLEWLIARGGIHNPEDVHLDSSIATRLVIELPVHNLSEKILDLRATLLSRAGYSVSEEEERIQLYLAQMSRTLPNLASDDESDFDDMNTRDGDIENYLRNASWTIKSEVGLWLRHNIKLQMDRESAQTMNEWSTIPAKDISQLSLEDFDTAKRYLLITEDYSMLADVLKLVSDSTNPAILASVADTLNLYLHTFAAIGALDNVFELLAAHIQKFKEQLVAIPRVLLVALSDLAGELSEQSTLAAYLKQELIRSDRKTAADACSPVSDHMALMQSAESDFSDEIERILASGNSMDKGTLERLFQRIVLRLEESLDKTPEQQRSCMLLLTRLKTFDVDTFNVLLSTWVTRFLHLPQRPKFLQILGPLISFGCISLPDVLRIVVSGSGNSENNYFEEALSLILTIPDVPEAMSSGEVCRLSIKQLHLRQYHPREAIFLIRRAIETSLPGAIDQSRLLGSDMEGLLQRLVLANKDIVVQELVKPLLQKCEPGVLSILNRLVDRLLLRDSSSKPINAETILDLANDLSLPFCQIKLATMFTSADSAMGGSDTNASAQLDAFNTAIESAVSNGKTSWSSIVPLLDSSIAKHLRQRATTQFLTTIPLLKALVSNEFADLRQNISHAKDLLHIMNATASSVAGTSPVAATASPGSEIPSALHNFWLILASTQVLSTQKDVIVSAWLPLMIQFTLAHRHVFENTKLGNENRGKTIITLAAIYLELDSRIRPNNAATGLAEEVYDMALFMVDALPDDVRAQCIRSLRDAASVPRMRYLFSIATNPSEWLVLVKREKAGAGPQGTNNATSVGSEIAKAVDQEKPTSYPLRRWEMLQEPTPNIGENDTSLSLTLFGARKG